MKFVLSALAAIALLAQPAFAAEHVHDHGSAAQVATEDAALPDGAMCDHENTLQRSLQKMRAQMAAINQTKDPAKRQRLLKEHNKSMRDSLKILREMMSGMDGWPAPAGAMPGRMMGGGGMGERIMGGNMDPMKCDHAKGEPAASPDDSASTSGSAATGPAKKFWTCPMHPDEVKGRPGTCRLCGMDLVDKAEMEAPPAGASAAPGVMKCDPKSGGMKGCCAGGNSAKCNHGMAGMKDCCMGGSGAKCDPRMSAVKCDHRKGMAGRPMDALLALMEQLIAHNEAAAAARK